MTIARRNSRREAEQPFGFAARLYTERGWPVFHLPRGEKKPPPRGYTGREGKTPTPETVEKWIERHPGGNIAIHVPPGVVGIDIDAYGDKTGDVTLAELEAELGELPPTWRSTSRGIDNPSGIRWFAAPALEFAGIAGAGIEIIQTKHRYAVVWPSVHPEGGTYEWFWDDAGHADGSVPGVEDLPELPEAWVERFAVGRGAGKAGRLASSATTSMEHEEAARWLGEHGSGQPCRAVRGVLRKALDDLDAAVETGAARYDVAVAGSMALILLAHEGHRGARPALKVLRDAYFEAVGDARDPADEWRRMVTEGISKAAALPEGASEAHEEGACPDREDGRFWPPPTAPYDVAARWVADRHTHTDGRTTLAHWRSDFYRWSGARWELHPESTISAELYRELAGASYWSAAQVPVELPWRPDAGKVRKVLDALAAFCHRPDGAEPDEGRGEIALADGVLDVASGELRPHCPSRFNLTALPFAQPSRADGCAAWLAFLADVFGEDAESIELLRQWFGYVVSGRTELQKIMFLLGPPRSGKGVITRTLERLVGPEARVAPTMDSLTTNFGLQPVIGRSLAVITDARFGGRNGSVVVERLLTVSGGDTLTIDRKNREPWTGRPIARWMIVTNELPGISDASGALARRVLGPLETVASLSDAEIDPHLERTISAELPGVLAWALEGLRCLDALDGVFTVPKVARATRREMAETFSPITAFLAECCALDAEGADGSLSCEATALYAVYRRWSEDSGQHAVSSLRFGRELKAALQGRIERTRTRRPDRSQVYVYRGIAPIPRARHDAVL